MDKQMVADILLVTRELYQLCQQCEAEAVRYQQVAKQAGELEQKLRQQLEKIAAAGNPGRRLSPEAPVDGLVERIFVSPDTSESKQPEQLSTASSKNGSRPAAEPPSLKVYCLGPFQVYLDDEWLTEWSSLKAKAIFKYLVTQQGTPVSKDTLMDLFWPEADPEAARRNLHQAIYSLRHTLRREALDYQPILFENDCYLLNPALHVRADFVEFERQVQAGRWLERAGRPVEAANEYSLAEAMYRGDFLEEDLFEDWTSFQREYLRNTYLDFSNRLGEYYLRQGDYRKVVQLCQKILKLDNCSEEAHRRLMRCYQAQGQRHLAVRQYQTCVQMLSAELDVPPSPETEMLYEQIISGVGFSVEKEPELMAA